MAIRRREYDPIHTVMLVYFGFNIISWRFGLFGTAGLLRYFVAVVPLLSVYAATALQFRDLLVALKRLTLLGLNPLLWQIVFTVAVLNSHTAAYNAYKSNFELLDTFGYYVQVHNHQITPAAIHPKITFGTDAVAPHLRRGWSEPEGWGTWALGPYSEFALYFSNPTTTTITISAIPQFVDRKQQTIDIHYNDVLVGHYTFVNDGQELEQFSFDVPRSLISGRLDLIRFTYGYAISPYDLGISNDGRQLAVGFVEMKITSR